LPTAPDTEEAAVLSPDAGPVRVDALTDDSNCLVTVSAFLNESAVNGINTYYERLF
jgi:hypothetical protein